MKDFLSTLFNGKGKSSRNKNTPNKVVEMELSEDDALFKLGINVRSILEAWQYLNDKSKLKIPTK